MAPTAGCGCLKWDATGLTTWASGDGRAPESPQRGSISRRDKERAPRRSQ